jgi:putative chitinase
MFNILLKRPYENMAFLLNILENNMDLENQFLAMGMTPEQAKEHAENFVKGLKELGLSDQKEQLTEAVPATIRIVSSNNNIAKALLRVGVKANLVQLYEVHLVKTMQEFKINNKNRQAMFLAQILHESAMLSATVENLNYSEKGLLITFKKYFDRKRAQRYARKPQQIANYVYANRMGNGNEQSGNGWLFRGRGLIQLTGKDNYVAAGKGLGVDLLKNPDYLLTPEGAARSAGWFWNSRNLNRTADAGNIRENTRLINGGFKGLDHRTDLYKNLLFLI